MRPAAIPLLLEVLVSCCWWASPAAAQQLCGGAAEADACGLGALQQSGYADNANCLQTLRAPPGSAVSLTFTSFSVEAHFDWLEVFDGASASAPRPIPLLPSLPRPLPCPLCRPPGLTL